jgi:hemoglobin
VSFRHDWLVPCAGGRSIAERPSSGTAPFKRSIRKTGARKRIFKLADLTDSGVLSTASDLVFAGSREGYIFFALDARAGSMLWKANRGGHVLRDRSRMRSTAGNIWRSRPATRSSRTRCGRRVSLVTSLSLQDVDIYAAIGEDGFQRLVAAFYRQVPGDDILGPMYPPDDLAGAEERLREFLIGRFGGPPRYIERRGHPRLRMRHQPFAVTAGARQRWMQLMNRALDEARFASEVDTLLRDFFDNVSTMMVNRRD